MSPVMTPETLRTVAVMTSQRFFIVQRDGTIKRLNDYGKAIDWVFNQKAAAVRAAARGKAAVWDKELARFVD